jgi:hypothetical protein
MEFDYYFNKQGQYLGKDEAKTDNVKIIDQKDWDANKDVDEKGQESIDHEVGEANSEKPSEAEISEESAKNVVDYYNPTDLKTENSSETSGMRFYAEENATPQIKINVNNLKEKEHLDYASVINNMYSHEAKHYSDYKQLGHKNYILLGSPIREQRAYEAQFRDKSFKNTPLFYQKSQKENAKGYVYPFMLEIF